MTHRIIIHVTDGQDEQEIISRLSKALPVYRGYHPDTGQRLTVRLESDGAMLIYNTWKDCVITVPKDLKV